MLWGGCQQITSQNKSKAADCYLTPTNVPAL